MSNDDPAQGITPKTSPILGRVVDFLFPIVLANLIFFGLQAYLNADGGVQIHLGMVKLLQVFLICAFVYAYLIRRVFKKLWPHWWA